MPKILKKEYTTDGASYQLQWPCGMVLWFDVWREGDDVTGDWNKYIFFTDDEGDMAQQAFQNAHNDDVGAYNAAAALDVCVEQYEHDTKTA